MNIGEKIKLLRLQNGLTQKELADRAELTKGFISQVEHDVTSISIATLTDVLECLGTNLRDFFSDAVEEKIVFGSADYFSSQDKEKGLSVDWIVPNAQKNHMEPILVTLEPGGCSEKHDPHAGDEFGYVLRGVVTVCLGRRRYKARRGECFYFRAADAHYLLNTGKSEASVLWISTPPSF